MSRRTHATLNRFTYGAETSWPHNDKAQLPGRNAGAECRAFRRFVWEGQCPEMSQSFGPVSKSPTQAWRRSLWGDLGDARIAGGTPENVCALLSRRQGPPIAQGGFRSFGMTHNPSQKISLHSGKEKAGQEKRVASNSRRTATLGRGHPIIGPKMLRGNYRAEMPVLNVVRFAHFGRVEQCPEMSQRFEPVSKSPIGLAAPRHAISPTLRQSEPLRSLKRSLYYHYWF